MNRKSTKTYKLGDIKSEKSASPFRYRLRWPGWYPDYTEDPKKKEPYPECLFLEETIGIGRGEAPLPFPVPFEDPSRKRKQRGKKRDDPNRWILGSPIPPKPKSGHKEPLLTTMVRDLAKMARQYNASLYRLRRLHFYKKFPRSPAPPANPHGGDMVTLPDPQSREFYCLACHAEENWHRVTQEFNDLLDQAKRGEGYKGLKLIAADMVAVNDYIVSMRVVANDLLSEIGGSSSHVSISSAFSSSGG